jgi:putative redox protein
MDVLGGPDPTPVQTLAFALAGCMGMDVVHILNKARQPLKGLRAELTASRAETEPRRITEVTLRFVVSGAVPEAQVERAIQLSRDKYCSVWHSLRQDIPFRTEFEIQLAAASS